MFVRVVWFADVKGLAWVKTSVTEGSADQGPARDPAAIRPARPVSPNTGTLPETGVGFPFSCPVK